MVLWQNFAQTVRLVRDDLTGEARMEVLTADGWQSGNLTESDQARLAAPRRVLPALTPSSIEKSAALARMARSLGMGTAPEGWDPFTDPGDEARLRDGLRSSLPPSEMRRVEKHIRTLWEMRTEDEWIPSGATLFRFRTGDFARGFAKLLGYMID